MVIEEEFSRVINRYGTMGWADMFGIEHVKNLFYATWFVYMEYQLVT